MIYAHRRARQGRLAALVDIRVKAAAGELGPPDRSVAGTWSRREKLLKLALHAFEILGVSR
jgi:hypothetical protein